ncbi:2-dehydro-3-deoxygalactonokinase [Caulobacter vibrioides]|uniref:2-dehydro-3-deoxygalactonokinase n=1 Tax=Caulobacter vibrioides TaxID=155892 RepID=UPI000BB51939|nr:2-dehydro-3-deoxygalactonokinase [Caulobacter vibrioides]ATC23757.1 2-dehydro-3-deoxygalactonokinase [Caulobacter vibrioides]AZH11994.1 2-dehydro-3-deoxygalactonokinase [Caulobacter vibrioides]PLR15426.1 2-dehydro-3-deoxygalactonokinase [Caulobacter vibrioides]
MDQSIVIVGDWGGSRLRLWLRQGKSVIHRRDGPGVTALTDSPEKTFLDLVGDWREAGPDHAILCGMVGSRMGWTEAPYAPCPATTGEIAARAVRIEAAGLPVRIVPGLSCVNPLGGPDVMRGEETQILGAMSLDAALRSGRHLLVLPGTHNKWAVVEDGQITTFLTAPIGETFALLKAHSTLGAGGGSLAEGSAAGFARGLTRIAEQGAGRLTHLMFETRARQLLEAMTPADAMGFLSGLLIGADVAAARDWFGPMEAVTVIGDGPLAALYVQALAATGVTASAVDGDAAVLAGLSMITRHQDASS